MKISRKVLRICIASAALLSVHASAGHAHDTWVAMQDYAVSQSKPVLLSVANAHRFVFPAEELLSPDRIDKIVFISPEGKEFPSTPQENNQYQSTSPPAAAGTHLAIAIPKGGFFSLTPKGFQRGKSRKDLGEVIECRCSEKFAKALFTVNGPGGDVFSRPLGHGLEIIPLKDPATIKEGDFLPVRVLSQGNPARTEVFGVYAGFSDEPNTFAYTTRTDKEGVAKIKIIKAGIWLLLAKEEKNYPDPGECDKLSRAASLTFQVK